MLVSLDSLKTHKERIHYYDYLIIATLIQPAPGLVYKLLYHSKGSVTRVKLNLRH